MTIGTELTDAEMDAAAHVGKAMLKAMRQTKLSPRQQINAVIHALSAIGPMVLRTRTASSGEDV